MENYKELPNWSKLTKDEKKRIELIWSSDYTNKDGSQSITKEELKKADDYAEALKSAAETADSDTPLGANTPLNPQGVVKYVDYRDPIWGDSYNWSWNRPLSQVEYLVIHHTVTSADATPDDIALLHKARGWGGIGYHFVITKDGTVYYVGDIGTARANVADMNEKVIGITMVGDFTQYDPTDTQIKSAHYLCKYFIENYPALTKVQDWSALVGHKDLTATACPGTEWHSSMRNRIVNNLSAPSTNDELKEELDKLKKDYKALDKKFEDYKDKNDPKLQNYNDAERTLRDYTGHVVDKDNFDTSLTQVIIDANTARRLFGYGKDPILKVLPNTEMSFPEGINRWIDGMTKVGLALDEYNKQKEYKLPLWIQKIVEIFAGKGKGGDK